MAEDNRVSLIDITRPYELHLVLDDGGKIDLTVEEEIGRGGSCIAYRATEHLAGGGSQTRVLKEFYPLARDVDGVRREGGLLRVPEGQAAAFERRLGRFEGAKDRFSECYEWDGGRHEMPRPFALGRADATTVYTVSDPAEGEILSADPPDDLHGIAEIAISLCEALRPFHDHKDPSGHPDPLLYLDLKPDNVYVYPSDGSLHARLFDFDSAVPVSDLRTCRYAFGSYSAGWAPPEQVRWDVGRMGPASDVYAVGAVLFWLVTGRRPTKPGDPGVSGISDIELISQGPFDWAREARRGLHFDSRGEMASALDSVASKALSSDPDERCKSVDALMEDLERLWSLTLVDRTITDKVIETGDKTGRLVQEENEATRRDVREGLRNLGDRVSADGETKRFLIEKNREAERRSKRATRRNWISWLVFIGIVAFVGFLAYNLIFTPSYADIELDCRLDGETGKSSWRKVIQDADVGDSIEFQISFTNSRNILDPILSIIDDKTGQKTVTENITPRVILPNNIEYIQDSTILYNSNHPQGALVDRNTLTTSGINIGNSLIDGNAYVRFKGRIIDKSLAPGANQLVTWANVTINGEVHDKADVSIMVNQD